MFIYFWETEQELGAGGSKERETRNSKQAPGSELSTQSLTWGSNHEPWDHDLSRSWMLNNWATQASQRQHTENGQWGAWVAWSVKCPTLDLGSGHDFMVVRLSPVSRSTLGWSLLKILSLSLSVCLSAHTLSLRKKKKKEDGGQRIWIDPSPNKMCNWPIGTWNDAWHH